MSILITTISEAAALLKKYQGKARGIAGGTYLIGVLKDNIHATYSDLPAEEVLPIDNFGG